MERKKLVDILIKDIMVLPMDGKVRFLKNASIAIDGGRIVALGDCVEYEGRETITLDRGVAIPGLINAHTHQTLTRGICEDLPLQAWLEKICFPLDAAYDEEDMRVASLLNQLEMIKGGITTFVDIYRHPAVAAETAIKTGMRAVISPQVIDIPAGVGETFQHNLEVFQGYHNKGHGRVHIWFGVHAPYSNKMETYKLAKEHADRYGVGVHTHLSETRNEVDSWLEKYKMSPVEWLHQEGILGDNVLAAHCVHISDEDIEILAETKTKVVYNPSSNMKLAAGVAPITRLQARGVEIAVGTDSHLSNNNLDMLEELRTGAFLQKLANNDAAAMPVYDNLASGTITGARCLGLGENTGSLEVGKKADITLYDFKEPHLWPIYSGEWNNVMEHLIYSASASDVHTTIIDGKIVMKNRQVLTIDEEGVYSLVQKHAHELCKKSDIESDQKL